MTPVRKNATLIVAAATVVALLVWWAPWSTNGPRTRPSFPSGVALRLNRALDRAVAGSGAPGAQAAVIRADGSVWTAGSGFANTETKQPMSPNLLVAIASITKLYTAALILDLAQDHVVGLDDPLERWVPGVPYAEGVTLRQLLTHTSGLTSDDGTLPPICKPGRCYSYSGAINLLGRVAEAASGMPFAAALRERIFTPLGLKATFYPLQEPAVGASATGYSTKGSQLAVEGVHSHFGGGPAWRGAGGALVATATDTARFAHALFTGSVLRPQMLSQMLDFDANSGLPGTSDCRGQGMVVQRSRGPQNESWFHGGLSGYFRSWVEHYPRQQVTVAVIVNKDVPIGIFTDALAREALSGPPAVTPSDSTGRCNYDISVLDSDGTARRITTDPAFEAFPSWSADGKHLVWAGERGGQGDLFVGAVNGSTPTRLTDDPANDVFPRWSPDGAHIAFDSNRDGDFEIEVMRPDGSDIEQLTHNDWDDVMPAWSPDGSLIAYVNGRHGHQIHVMNADGTGDRQITDAEDDEWPAWSPDGKRLAYTSGGSLFLVSVRGGRPKLVPIPQIRVIQFPAWWPGKEIAFEADLDLWAVGESGSGLRRLTATSTEEQQPAWSPDGSTIAYQIGLWEAAKS